jgi:type I restriction-modification system DNA methylase subunit
VARLIEELSRSISADDLIGKVFHEIIPLEFRKLIAAFYTNSAAGDLLAGLSIDGREAKVLDPACGSGTLLVSSYKRKGVLASKVAEKRELHRQFLENDITGLDAMAFSAHLAAIHLVLQEPSVYTENLRIGTTDSTFARPGKGIKTFGATIRQAFRQRNLESFETGEHLVRGVELTEAGAVRLKGQVNAGFILDKVDLVIMNPPFTSSRRLSADYKDDLKEWFRSNSRYRRIIKGNISYQAYFMCLADKFLEDGGRIAAVLPFTTLIGGDFSELTKFLVNNYSIDYIIMGKGRLAFSENTYFTEVLFVARKGAPDGNEKSLLIRTKTSPALWKEKEVESMIALLRRTKEYPKEIETDMCEIIPFDQKELLPENKTLTGLVADFDKEYRQLDRRIKSVIDEQEKVTTFSKLVEDNKLDVTVAEVVHGRSRSGPGHSLTRFGGDALVICRSEDRALMKHDRLIFKEESPRLIKFFDKQTGDEFSMVKSNVKGALRRFAYFEYIDATGREDFVISGYDDRLEDIYDKIYGSERTIGYLKDVKEEWKKVVEKGTATVCVPGRMNLAAPGTKILALRSKNDMFMCSFMWGISGLSQLEEKILVLWINSALFMHYLLTHHTVTGGSWVKLHSKQMMKMPLPSFNKLTKQERSELGRLYTRLKDVRWTSLYEQYSAPTDERIELDSTILRIVGFSRKDIEGMREDLYKSIIRTFDAMREVMKAGR